ncbi:MAG: DNA polymerase III subunit delta' [Alphaproteobacteria bacterium]|nr:DNA polymerase III subunit delta' [Alphaproteobacteria bacterium]
MSEPEVITPRNNSFILGQEAAEETFLRAWKGNNMHHAWILSGPKGVGKATMAFRIARFLLSYDGEDKEKQNSLNISENSNIFKQVAGGSHPDLLVVERDYIETDKRKLIASIRKGEVLSPEDMAELKKSAFIRVDEIRKVNDFLAKTSFSEGWRVVIIDSADDMNKSAANALLKILEEPPAKTVLLLISHNPGTLLATIRSRCAKLPLKRLSDNEVASLLRRYRSDLNENMIAKLAELSEGSIGKAILYADVDGPKIYNDLAEIILRKRNFSLNKMLEFCEDVAADADKFSILPALFTKLLKENFSECQDKEALYNLWNDSRKMFEDCDNINMEKRVMLINLLNELCKVL